MGCMPTLRGFVVGLALLAGVCASLPGCLDHSRVFVDPTTGKEVSIKAGKIVLPEDDANFVGPPAPTFSQGKAAATEDFNKSVRTLTWWACTLCIVAGVGMLIASFFLPWASTKLAAYCLAGAALTLISRYVLLTYGTIAADVAVWLAIASAVGVAVLVGLPALIAYVRRIDWHNGVALAQEPGKEREGTALLARASVDVNSARQDVAKWLVQAKSAVVEEATAAKAKLAEVGVKL